MAPKVATVASLKTYLATMQHVADNKSCFCLALLVIVLATTVC